MPLDVIDSFIAVPLPDGRTLRAHLWLPKGAGPLPAILDTNPYRSWDLSRPSQNSIYPYWASHGYACLCVDTAGSGNSDGVLLDEYPPAEIDDALAIVDWCANQPWCNGKIGMHGFSWAAFVALRAAARKPAALKAMVLGGVSEDGWRTDIHHLGGVPYVAQVDWAGTMLMFNALPPDPALVGEAWLSMWQQRLDANRPLLEQWMAHPSRDTFWEGKAARLTKDETQLPLLLYCGTGDKYAASVTRIAEAWDGTCKTILGPWDHTLPDFSPREPSIGFLSEALRWWDTWLKDANNGVLEEPAYRIWIGAPDAKAGMADGAWVGASTPYSRTKEFLPCGDVLMSEGAKHSSSATLTPSPRTPSRLTSDLYEDTPGPFDLTDRPGSFLSVSTPVEQDARISGNPILQFHTDAPSGEVVGRLLDLAPDGTAIRIATGATTIVTGPNAIVFQTAAWCVRPGHKIALLLSAEGWPTFWLSRNTGAIHLTDMRLMMPLIDASGTAPVFPEPHVPASPNVSPLKWIDPEKQNLPSCELPGATVLTRRVMANHLDETGTDYCISKRFAVVSGACESVWRAAIERPGWSVNITTRLCVHADPDAFVIEWMLQADCGDGMNVTREGLTQIARSVF